MMDSKRRRKVKCAESVKQFIDIEAEVDSEEEDTEEWSSDGEG